MELGFIDNIVWLVRSLAADIPPQFFMGVDLWAD
jgi:hypothetical protein